ncbi:MAG: type II secretion system protein N [Candidatus Macondimonas sp.]
MLSPLKGELRRRIPLIVSMGVGVAMIVHLGWALRAPAPARPSAPASEPGIAPAVDFLALALRAPLLDGAASTPSAALPTALEARLQGVSTGWAVPLAIIDFAGHPRVVAEGDALGDKARVHRILPDRVLLQHGTRIEALALHRATVMSRPVPDKRPVDDVGIPDSQDDTETQQWLQTLSEGDPETAAWLRERLRELQEREPND